MMASPDLATRTTPLSTLRVFAIVGVILAMGVIVFAFSRSLLLGLVALAVAPAVPLTLVVVADRVLRR
jgi:hypothetical protein